MSLMADESKPTVQDMLNCDGSLMDVAGAEGIDLQSKLAMARAEILTKLQIFLVDHGESPTTVESVVVTEPLGRWITLTAISLAFRDGHFRHLSDRYKEKWLLYERLAEGAREDLMRMGVGYAAQPLRRPSIAAIDVVQGSLPEGSYLVAVSTVDASGTESEVSQAASLYLDTAGNIQISAPLLDPALRWNAYAGRTADELQRQNQAPLTSGEPFTLQVLASYGRPGGGQIPTTYKRETRVIRRG